MPTATRRPYTPRSTRATPDVPGGRYDLQVKVDPRVRDRVREIAPSLDTTVAEVNRLVFDLGLRVVELAVDAGRYSLEDLDRMLTDDRILSVRKRPASRKRSA